jgi:nitroimidazol reductase NimA-like FMN-containing flavoprotein (pyridoxamine 5'-phosphate oxidase superfamily)
MFRGMRRQDRQLENSEVIELFEKGEYGVLSSVGEDGYAYGVPLSYAYSDGSIYFHSATEGQKLDNIRNNSKVSFCVIGGTEVLAAKFSTKYESVIAFGIAEVIEGEEKMKGLMALVEKYSPEFMEAGRKYAMNDEGKTKVVKIKIEHMTGKARR